MNAYWVAVQGVLCGYRGNLSTATIGFLTYVAATDGSGDVISAIGPNMALSGAIFNASGGINGNGYIDTVTNPAATATGDGIASDLLRSDLSERPWRFEFWAKMGADGMMSLLNSVGNEVLQIEVNTTTSNFRVSHTTTSGFGASTNNHPLPDVNEYNHYAVEKMPGVTPKLYTNASGGDVGTSFGWTTAYGDTDVAQVRASGGILLASARFMWFDSDTDADLYAVGGYQADNPL